MVSIALDDEKERWIDAIKKDTLPWTQLVDEKMWFGPTAKTLKLDSIPFNFLVDKQGRILAKAIRPDSLHSAIARYLK